MDKGVFEYRVGCFVLVDHSEFLDDFIFCILYDVMNSLPDVFDSAKLRQDYFTENFVLDIVDESVGIIKVEVKDSRILMYSTMGFKSLSLYNCDAKSIVDNILDMKGWKYG